MSRNKNKGRLQKLLIILLSPYSIGVIGALATAICSISLGQSLNYDLLNYHYYDGFAICAGRLQQDILAASLQTYINPALYVPFYLSTTCMLPVVTGFIIGLVQGLNLVLIYIIARQMLCSAPVTSRDYITYSLVSLGIAAVGITAPMFVSEIGAVFGDNITSILVLAAIALIFHRSEQHRRKTTIIVGLLMGAAVGLKLTNGIFIFAAMLCGWWYEQRLKSRIINFGLFSLSICLGFLLLHGWWSWYLLKEYGNPVFPFFNVIFRSPYFEPSNFRDLMFLPKSAIDALSYPFQWAAGLNPSAELPFRDYRFALISVLLVTAIIIVCARYIRHKKIPVKLAKVQLILFFLIGYAIWLLAFSIQRYIIVLELLSGLIVYLLLEIIIKSSKYRILTFIPVVLLLILTTVPANWGRVSWSSTWFDVKVPPKLMAQNEMFVMFVGDYSYLIPSFPSDARFICIRGYYIDPSKTKFEIQIRQAIEHHKGPVYLISMYEPDNKQLKSLFNYGLIMSNEDSICVTSKGPPVYIYHLFPKSQFTAGQWDIQANNILNLLYAEWEDGFYDLQGTKNYNYRWCSARGTLVIINPSSQERKLRIKANFRTGHQEISNLKIESSLFSDNLKINNAWYIYEKDIIVPPGEYNIVFTCDAKRVEASDDTRYLVFVIGNFQLYEIQ